MKKGKGEKGKGSVKDSSGSGVRVNYKVVSIVVVVLLLLFLVFVFNRGGDSEDDGWGSLFSFRIDSDPFPFPLPDLEFGPESDSDPESDSNPESDSGCPREGDDEGLTQICNRALEADDAENEFICCKESQECDTTEDGEPLCGGETPKGGLCPPDRSPSLTTTCYGQERTASEGTITCCSGSQGCATKEDGEATCVNPLQKGQKDRWNDHCGRGAPILCKFSRARSICCPEARPFCFNNRRGYFCSEHGFRCGGGLIKDGVTCCGADGEVWACPAGRICGPPSTWTCPPIGYHSCMGDPSYPEDLEQKLACPDGSDCCNDGCCPKSAICDYDYSRNKFYCRNVRTSEIVSVDPAEDIEVNV